ncbi:MAG: Zn-ribbon protein [Acidimicrobiales bacterium]|nr:Zn-ribbon protein [Acidimicrobiales bacterium]
MASQFDTLLEVQAHDTRLDQIFHLMEELPAREERDAAAAALAGVETSIAGETVVRDELARQQKRLDDEIETINVKRKSVNDTLYGGTVTSPGELNDLTKEIDALGRRITQLEDQDLEIMEQLEPLDARLAELSATREQRAVVLADAELRLTAAEAELAVELAVETEARDRAAAQVDADLLAEYTSLRGGRGGIGVARLIGTQCGGCHLTLSAVEAARIRKHPDEVTHCEECGRLLVP